MLNLRGFMTRFVLLCVIICVMYVGVFCSLILFLT